MGPFPSPRPDIPKGRPTLPASIPSASLPPGGTLAVSDERGRTYVLYRATTEAGGAVYLAPGACFHQGRDLRCGTVRGRQLCCACIQGWTYEGAVLRIPGANHSAIDTQIGRTLQAIEAEPWIHFGVRDPDSSGPASPLVSMES